MLGLGHAILTGEPLIGNEPFAVILADDLCDCDSQGVIAQMIDVYEKLVKGEESQANLMKAIRRVAGEEISSE